MKTFKKILMAGVAIGVMWNLAACSPDPSISYGYGKEAYAKQDYKSAFRHFLEAAKWRDPNAQYAVAYMYYYGIGVQQNLPEAVYWMKCAAASGNKNAIAILPALKAQVPNMLFMDQATAAQYASGDVSGPIHPQDAVKPEKKLIIAKPVQSTKPQVTKTTHSTAVSTPSNPSVQKKKIIATKS